MVLISCELSAMNATLINAVLEGKEPLHIVTLTRAQANEKNEVKRDDSNYLPITASEAVTVFSIVGLLFDKKFSKEEFDRCIKLAYQHDSGNLEEIEKRLANPFVRRQLLETKLKRIGTKGENLDWLQTNYKEGLLPLEVKVDKEVSCFILVKNALFGKNISKSGIKDYILPEDIKFEDILDDQYSVVLGKQIRNILENIESEARCEVIKGFPELRGYLTFNINDVNKDYSSLFQKMSDLLKDYVIEGNVFFVSNELFFGKSFVLSNEYRRCIPRFMSNVLTCINFLLEEKEELSNLSRIVEDSKLMELWSLPHQDYKNRITVQATSADKKNVHSFRSVSFYCIYKYLVQEYTKRSYFKEADEVILDDGYDYLFGTQTDYSDKMKDFLPFISTQICFDLSSGVQKGQKGTPIHVVQSNTLSVLDNLNHIPVGTQFIIHADPFWQELLQVYQSSSIDLSVDQPKPEKQDSYSSLPPVETITFYIDKGKYKEAYTITHWILNKHLLKK